MNRLHTLLICLVILTQSCNGQVSSPKEIYNRDFNWTITIPENFEHVRNEQWAKMQNRGAEAIEKAYDEKVINQAKTIFVFKSDQMNYLESNYQPFDTELDGDYLGSRKTVNDILYETFKAQMPDVKIDSIGTVEKIDNLEFQVFKMKVEYPNKKVLNILMFSRLFDKKEFSVNIMFVDKWKGEQMLDAWMNSKFTK